MRKWSAPGINYCRGFEVGVGTLRNFFHACLAVQRHTCPDHMKTSFEPHHVTHFVAKMPSCFLDMPS